MLQGNQPTIDLMRDWISTFFAVLYNSRKTQWAFIIGMLLFILINEFGAYFVAHIEFTETHLNLVSSIKQKLLNRYDKVALITLISFWALGIRLYRKDKNELFS